MDIMRYVYRILILIILLAVAFLVFSCGSTDEFNEQQLEAEISNDLPVGTPYESVEKYLADRKIEHSWVEEETSFYAIIRESNKAKLIEQSLSMIIRMDNDGKLSKIEFKLGATGP